MAFIKRKIDVAIKLVTVGTNQPIKFAGTNSDTLTLSGYRASVRIQNSGGLAGSQAEVSVWGMALSVINQLQTLGMVIKLVPGDTITITAGDADTGMATVFIGTIYQAYADYNSAPDVPMRFECRSGSLELAAPYPATSYTGATDVATILSTIANKNSWGFENNGVTAQLSNPYLPGSAMEQVRRVAQAANINAELFPGSIQQKKYLLSIWPRYGSRPAAGIPLISSTTGMHGYPSFTQQGIQIKTMFDPRIVLGGQIKVESSIFTPQALQRIQNVQTIWNVAKIDHALDAEMPRGEWMSTIIAYNPNFPQPIPPRSV